MRNASRVTKFSESSHGIRRIEMAQPSRTEAYDWGAALAEGDDIAPVPEQALKDLGEAAALLVRYQDRLKDLEDLVKKGKAEIAKLEEDVIPNLLQGAGLEKVTLDSGHEITVREELYASIPKKNASEVAGWLDAHGLSALVANDVTIPFDRGDKERAEAVYARLQEEFGNVSIAETFHTGSVKAALKELLADGVDVPLNLFGARLITKAKVN